METGWTKLESYSQMYLAEMAKGTLEANGIACVLMNTQDSSYLFGDIDLYVSEENEENAIEILKANKEIE